MALEPSTPPESDAPGPGQPQSGLSFCVSSTLEEVQEAWSLVYQSYLRDDLIDPNPHEIHTTEQAAGPRTAVVLACLGPMLVGTLSVYADETKGLPLDSVYLREINAMRKTGTVMEIGMFADRREHMKRSADGLFELMRFAFYFALHMQIDNAIIGVHPRHAPFYMRLLGFQRLGAVRSYPTVKDRAVVLLGVNVKQAMAIDPVPKGVRHFLESPLSPDVFSRRFRFDDPRLSDSRIGRFLADRRRRSASVA
jgi:hypothetical protein